MMTSRIKIAVEFMKDVQSFNVGDLRLGVGQYKSIEIKGCFKYLNFGNLTKAKCFEELQEIKS